LRRIAAVRRTSAARAVRDKMLGVYRASESGERRKIRIAWLQRLKPLGRCVLRRS
jgi:hypothetical protein